VSGRISHRLWARAVRGAAAGDIPAADPAVGVGPQLPLQLHQAPDLGPVDPNIGLDVRGRLLDGGELDAEQLGASLQRRPRSDRWHPMDGTTR